MNILKEDNLIITQIPEIVDDSKSSINDLVRHDLSKIFSRKDLMSSKQFNQEMSKLDNKIYAQD